MLPEIFRDDALRLETPRLWLRWPKALDVPTIERHVEKPEVALMTRIPHPLPAGEVEKAVMEMRTANADGAGLTLALTRKRAPDQVIGMLGLREHYGSGGREAEIGYWLAVETWKQGLMSEAVTAMLDSAFRWSRIEAVRGTANAENPASSAVLEKAGFRSLGRDIEHLPVRGGDVAVERYILPRQEWRSRWRPAAGRTVKAGREAQAA